MDIANAIDELRLMFEEATPQEAEAIASVLNELDRLQTWDGLMSTLDGFYPEDLCPTLPDAESRDPGPRILSLLRWVDRLRATRQEAATVLREIVALAVMVNASTIAERADALCKQCEAELVKGKAE